MPGVVKLFGEHAVVYGRPAIAAAIDRGTWATCTASDRLTVEVSGHSARLVYNAEGGSVEARGAEGFLSYVSTALRLARDTWGPLRAAIRLEGDFPPGAGVATSAGAVVAVLATYAACRGARLDRGELARLAHMVELEVQGAASPMDTWVATHGGVVKLRASPFSAEPIETSVDAYVVVLFPRRGTTGQIVADVKRLVGSRRSASAVLDAIGAVVEEAEACLRAGDAECVGQLMYINNWLLGALGVVDAEAVSLIERARPYIYGGKISGAGRGGAVLLLPRDFNTVKVLVGHMPHYVVKVDRGGVRVI